MLAVQRFPFPLQGLEKRFGSGEGLSSSLLMLRRTEGHRSRHPINSHIRLLPSRQAAERPRVLHIRYRLAAGLSARNPERLVLPTERAVKKRSFGELTFVGFTGGLLSLGNRTG
jgi:hypothetical protein